MKKAALFLAVVQIFFLCGCSRTHPVNAATADESSESGEVTPDSESSAAFAEDVASTASTENDSYEASTSGDSSAAATVSSSSPGNGETPAPGVKINDSRLTFSDFFYDCIRLSDDTLLLRYSYVDNGTVKLTSVSLPGYKFKNQKTIPIKTSPVSCETPLRADQGNLLVFSDIQAIKLDSHLNILKTVNFADHDLNDMIVDVNGSLNRLLFADDEGLKIADTNFKNTKLLLKHPQWSGDMKNDREAYLDGRFVDNDTKVFAYTDGNDDDLDKAAPRLAVYDLKAGKTYVKSCVTGRYGSYETDIENTRQDFVYLNMQNKEPEYDLVCFDDKNCAFTEKKICAIPEKKLAGEYKCLNAYVGLNSRYIVYTRLDNHDDLVLCRYDRESGKTSQKVFPSGAYDARNKDLKFWPYLILPDGRVVIQYNDSNNIYLVDFK